MTTEDRLGSILETGIRPSAYGDMAVVGDDGAGVYAVRNDARLIRKVLGAVVDTETLGHVYAVKFRYKGRYVECVDSVEHSSQGGYIHSYSESCVSTWYTRQGHYRVYPTHTARTECGKGFIGRPDSSGRSSHYAHQCREGNSQHRTEQVRR